MKYLVSGFALFSLMSCSILNGGEDIVAQDVPSVVKNAFSQEFPEALDVEWEKKQDGFEADFELQKVDFEALFSEEGNILMVKEEIPLDALPEAVRNTLAQNYKDQQLEDAEKIVKDGVTYYQVELEANFRERHEVFTSDGQVVENIKFQD